MRFETSTVILGTSSMAIFCFVLWIKSAPTLERAVTSLEQLGKMGQREIARSYSACLTLALSAGGAGLVTAGTVILKMRILYAPFTLVGGGLIAMLNFALSFLLMQACGFRLATKQSPLLGASLARRWRILRKSLSPEFIHTEIRWSFLTQTFSAMGNLLFVIPAAFAFQWVFLKSTGTHFLDAAEARSALQSLHPWKTASLCYAAFTGVILWLCAISGGAVANRFRPFSKTMATALFNICLGALLAFIPVIGKSLHIPLDVRHFTLSGGLIAMATASLGFKKAWDAGLLAALCGVLMIGVLNFSVSFALAFVTAWAEGGNGKEKSSFGLAPALS